FQKRATGHSLPWLRDLRESAFARFCEVGFPTTHDEDWRFTNVSAIARTQFELAHGGEVRAQDAEQFRLRGPVCQLAFVDGKFAPTLSSTAHLPPGVRVNGLAQEIAQHSDVLEPHLGRYLNIQRDAFSALNTAFAEDGAYVHIRKGVVLEAPVALLFLS